MPPRHLALLSIALLGAIILVLFWIRTQPVWEPQTNETPTSVRTLEQPTITFLNPQKGPRDAKVTIVEFGDFQCGPCAQAADAIAVVQRTIPDVRVVWKHLPNDSAHPLATRAAIASQCAAQQGKFWEYHDALFAKQLLISETRFVELAQKLQLNQRAFNTCLEREETLPMVEKDTEEGLALGITATPTFFVGSERLVGAISAEELLRVVRQALSTTQN